MFSRSSLLATILFLLSFTATTSATTFVVNTNADTDDGACNASNCSVREAINAANANGAGADIVEFDIPGSGVKTIMLVSTLPEINSSITIDGTTQTGYFGKPMVEISGEDVIDSYGIDIGTAFGLVDMQVTIKALALNGHLYAVYGNSWGRCDITLQGNFIGTDPTGTMARKNAVGVNIYPRNDSVLTIGGNGLFEGNLISGNGQIGVDNSWPGSAILIRPHYSTVDELYNAQVFIQGNRLGTNFNGDAIIGNEDYGIHITEADGETTFDRGNIDVTIGGDTPASRNIISGNDASGINLEVRSAVIKGNYIGTNAAGTSALGNGQNTSFDGSSGIALQAMNGGSYTIGGPATGEGNLISGNAHDGIAISAMFYDDPANLKIQGNFIGTDPSGSLAIENGFAGIDISQHVYSDLNITIGGATSSARNIISGNGGNGVQIGGGAVAIYNNHIGTNAAGNSTIPNDANGIQIVNDAVSVIIGGTLTPLGISLDAGNLISGNGGDGIEVTNHHLGTTFIRRNRIGTDITGNNALPNHDNGISVSNANTVIGADLNASDGNIISGNSESGIAIWGASADNQNTKVFGNAIGTNGVGGSPLPNGVHGINLNSSSNNQIGSGAIGSKSNTISSNGQSGIHISGSGSTGNRIEGNYIGTGPIGNDLGNGNAGVRFDMGATGNYVGATSGAGNVIAFNGYGVFAFSGTDNEIRRNSIFSNNGLGIDIDQVGVTANDPGDGDSGGNRKQNFPVLNRATPNAISGTLNSTPGGNFTVDFYRVDSCDASGHGEGRYYLGSTLVQANAVTGDGSFEFPAALSIGQVVTATATVTNIIGADDTSEFSQCKLVTPAPAFAFSTTNYSVSEAAAARTITIIRSGATDGVATINFGTSDVTAINSQDYTTNTGTLVFGDGETIKTFDVSMLPDTLDEDDETIQLWLSSPTGGATVTSPSAAVLTITDNDDAPTISITDVSKNEGDAGAESFEFTVSLSAASGKQVAVIYATANVTATAASDYGATNGGQTFSPGQTQKTVTVPVFGDVEAEPNETFNVTLSNAANASVSDGQGVGTIVNDDAEYSIRGEVRRPDNAPIVGVSMTLSGTESAQTTTDENGRYKFDGLAEDGNYTITPVANGYEFTPVDRDYFDLGADIADANFTGSSEAPRSVDVISGSVMPGQTGGVSIQFEATGNENSIAFSLDYDGTLLSNPQVSAQGGTQGANLVLDTSIQNRVGITFTLPPGQSFMQGSHSMASVTFSSVLTNAASTPIDFSDEPVARAVTDTTGSEVTSSFTNGFVFFAQGYESDVSPRPTGTGDGTIAASDLEQVGKFVVGTDSVSPLVNEFQRADSAPRTSFGNGVLSVADYVQSARYNAGMDPAVEAGGNVTAVNLKQSLLVTSDATEGAATLVMVSNAVSSPNANVNLSVNGEMNGGENAVAFTLNFDPSKLLNAEILVGNDAQNATLMVNQTTPGKAAVMLALPAGQTFLPGTKQLVGLRFTVAGNAPAGQIPVTLDSTKTITEVVNANAFTVPAAFQNGYVNVLGSTTSEATIDGRVTSANGRPLNKVTVTITGPSGFRRNAITNAMGYYQFVNIPTGDVYSIAPRHKRYTFTPVSLLISDNVDGVNFVAQE